MKERASGVPRFPAPIRGDLPRCGTVSSPVPVNNPLFVPLFSAHRPNPPPLCRDNQGKIAGGNQGLG
jgi:hypothetical protein